MKTNKIFQSARKLRANFSASDQFSNLQLVGNELVGKPRILILGGDGFIGSHLVNALCKGGYFLRVFGRLREKSHPHSDNIEHITGDLGNEYDLIGALEDIDICFHLISTVLPKSSNQDPIFDIETNLISTVRFLNLAVKANLKKIIFISSGGTVYGTPQYLPIDEYHSTYPRCSYGIIKLAIEKYLHLFYELYGLDYQILRLANPYGKGQKINNGQGVVNTFLTNAVQGKEVDIWGDGSTIRDYIYISDVVSALIKSITYNGPHKTLNIGSGQGLSLNQVLQEIEILLNKKIVRRYKPARSLDVPSSVLSIKNAIQALQWNPIVNFRDGLNHLLT